MHPIFLEGTFYKFTKHNLLSMFCRSVRKIIRPEIPLLRSEVHFHYNFKEYTLNNFYEFRILPGVKKQRQE